MKNIGLRWCTLLLLPAAITPIPQIQFASGSSNNSSADNDIGLRLGLLATDLGVDPLASSSSSNNFNNNNNNNGQLISQGTSQSQVTSQQGGGSSSFTQQPSGREPTKCCCISANQVCPSGGGSSNDDFADIIDQRGKTDESDISIRIVNEPNGRPAPLNRCPANTRACCGPTSVFPFSSRCVSPQDPSGGVWSQLCQEKFTGNGGGVKECGRRQFNTVSGLQHGQTSPGEFPWTCLLLDQNNGFLGTCAIIPSNSDNNNARGTRKVITAAHKLKNLGRLDQLKVRVGEYDASGFNPPETIRHEEYTVIKILEHPGFDDKRLNNDITLLTVDRNIDLSQPNVNTACLPSCNSQFDFRFNNGTGTRCWVAGWGKNAANGQFQVVQRKVDLPMVDYTTCNNRLKRALNNKQPGLGNKFNLDASELCAGGEIGKDACTGDGGSPLVCESVTGRWTVVGLVTWGVGCASDVPGVYVKLSHFKNWIDRN